jgi:hypothetical protein
MPVGESSKVRWIRALRSGLRPALAGECAQNAARLVRDLWGHILVRA